MRGAESTRPFELGLAARVVGRGALGGERFRFLRWRPWVTSLLLLLLVGCAGTPEQGPAPANPALDPTMFGVTDAGPLGCGHRVLQATYSALSSHAARTIPVHVWYPTTATEGTHPRYLGIFADPFAVDDAPLAGAPWPSGFPVLAHSHGYKGFAGNSARMMCHFAMHGWVAIAPEHVGNTLSDTPDPLPLAIFYERPLDVRHAIDTVASLAAPDPLAGRLDLTRLAVSGHSFGIFTAWALAGATFEQSVIVSQCTSGKIDACSEAELALFDTPLAEPRAKAAIPMAGGQHAFFGEAGLDAVKLPVLLMTGALDDVGGDAVFSSTQHVDVSWIDVEGGCHQLFGLGNTSLGGTGCSSLPDEEGFGIVNPFALAYARYHVLGERGEEVSGIALGTKSLSSRVHYQHHGP